MAEALGHLFDGLRDTVVGLVKKQEEQEVLLATPQHAVHDKDRSIKHLEGQVQFLGKLVRPLAHLRERKR